MKFSRLLVLSLSALLLSVAFVLPLRNLIVESFQPTVTTRPEFRLWQSADIELPDGETWADGNAFPPQLSDTGNRGLIFLQNIKSQQVSALLWETGNGVSKLSAPNENVSAAAISGDGMSAWWLTNGQLHVWESGRSVRTIAGRLFPGSWGISLSRSGDRGLIFSKDQQGAYIVDFDRDNSPRFTTFGEGVQIQAARIEAQRIEMIGAAENDKNHKKTLALYRQRSRLQFDIDRDGFTDVLIGAGKGKDYLWQAYSLSGVNSAAPSVSAALLRTITYRLGDPDGIPIPGDYNGDGVIDLATFSPSFTPWTSSRGNWDLYISQSSLAGAEWNPSLQSARHLNVDWGRGDVAAVPADYDGDGATDVAIFRRADAVWHILFSGGQFDAAKGLQRIEKFGDEVQWGAQGDVPIAADFDGNGYSDFCVVQNYHSEEHRALKWMIRFRGNSKREMMEFQLGQSGDIALAADIDGDGEADAIAFHRALVAGDVPKWLVRYGSGEVGEILWSVPDGLPFAADFDGDGKDDLAFFLEHHADSLYVLNSRIAPKLLETTGYRPPFVTRLNIGNGNEKPVQILLRDHQLGMSPGGKDEK